jgi:uncharacterized protein (DUF983 family)
MNDGSNNPTPQFGTAEYAGTRSQDVCQSCQQPIGRTYYRLNDAMVCPACFEKMSSERAQDSHAAFVRGITAGVGAAVLGMIGFAIIAIILQGWVISYMSIGVGWLVGVAMMKYSGGVGGRRYQIAAALLTYAAVSMAAIPIGIYQVYDRRPPQQTQQQKLAAEQRQLEDESGQQSREPAPKVAPSRPRVSLGVFVGRLALLGLASPFYQLRDDPFWGAMGLLILFVGMKFAWKIAAGRPFAINGPFENTGRT